MSEPAFPGVAGEDGYGPFTYHELPDRRVAILHNQGMTLLDYFAGQALAGMLAGGAEFERPEHGAYDAYNYGQAMLNEKAKRESTTNV